MNIPALLDAMTLAEQAGLLAGADFWTTVPVPRLEVPAFKVSDGPNGARGGEFKGGVQTSCFPVGIALGATWNVALLEATGRALAQEARDKGARVLLAPTVNLQRSTHNGRNFECYSEDPWLTGELANAYIRGLQGSGVAATIKHFVGNESEYQRMTISSQISERALRELYLLPFEKAVKEAGVWAVMAAYNRLDGIYACDHARLLQQVLRDEWGFDGLVMSDWGALHSTAEGVRAGTDLEMPGPALFRGAQLVAAVESGELDAGAVRACAERVLRLAERVGAFADPQIPAERAVDRPETRALIRRLGAEGCVLLKNDRGMLPLASAADARIALVGPAARNALIMGGGSATVNAMHVVSPEQGLAEALPHARITTLPGADNHRWVPIVHQPMTVDFYASPDLSGPVVLSRTFPSSEQWWAGGVDPAIDGGEFSARARVRVEIAESGEYQVSLISAGLLRCKLGGETLIDNWSDWRRGETYFTFGSDERVVKRRFEAGEVCEFTLEFSTATPEPVMVRAIRFGLHLPLGEAALAAAEAAARTADVAIVCVGLNAEWDCEGLDRMQMALPHRQNELVSRVLAANPNTVVVLQTGAPVALPWIDQAHAVLQAWYPGQECGHAFADVLLGRAEPGGRLPQTWPRRIEDQPTYGSARRYPGIDGEVHYDEGIFIGYRHYQQHAIEPQFCFGHGLSYTRFEHRGLELDRATLAPGATLGVTTTVRNAGTRSGSEVVQVYVHDEASDLPRPPQELKAFAKVELAPGAERTLRLSLPMRAFAYYDEARAAWVAQAGRFEVRVGASAHDIRQRASVMLEADWVEPTA